MESSSILQKLCQKNFILGKLFRKGRKKAEKRQKKGRKKAEWNHLRYCKNCVKKTSFWGNSLEKAEKRQKKGRKKAEKRQNGIIFDIAKIVSKKLHFGETL